MNKFWENIDAKTKRMIVVGSILAGVILLIAIFVASNDAPTTLRQHFGPNKERSILTAQPLKTMNMDRIHAELKRLKAKNKNIEMKLKRIELQDSQKQVGGRNDPRNIEALVNKQVAQALAAQKAALSSVKITPMEPIKAGDNTTAIKAELRTDQPEAKSQGVTVLTSEDNPFANQKNITDSTGQSGSSDGVKKPLRSVKIRHVVDKSPTVKKAKVVKGLFIPAGSRFDGILLNGIDAGTGKQARENPYPVVVRIKKEAVLPNRYKLSDVKECFLMASGYGELSSERVYLRTETISCIRKDHGVLEAKINMYVVGEDSKAGLRGRLVSKQGQLLAKALMAGFFQGVAGAFNQQAIPSLNTAATPGSAVGYQSLLSGQTLQTGVAKGFGAGFDRLSQFYLNMAEQIFPVLEIDAGRHVSFQMTNGVELKFKESK